MMAVIDYHHDEMFRGISPYHVITTLAWVFITLFKVVLA